MKVLVTGGAGFIGSHLVDRLVGEGHHVDVIDDLSSGSLGNLAEARAGRTGRLTIHQVGIGDPGVPDLMVRRAPEVVFHLAAVVANETFDGAVADAEANVVGSLNVLEGARRAGVRKVVFASDGRCTYGSASGAELPIREKHPQRPLTPHGVAKRAMVDYLAAYREAHALEFTALVLAEVYGPRQRHGLVAEMITSLQQGQVTPDVPDTTDLVFVDDVVDAFVRAAGKGSGLVANIGTGVEISVSDLAAMVAEHLGVTLASLSRSTGPEGPRRFALDPGRARIHLGWSPWTTLADGLAQTLASPPP